MRTVPDQIRQWVPGRFHVLGTDGYGRSDLASKTMRKVNGTARNWGTVTKLLELLDA